MKHKHAELIHAWADGAEIQYFDNGIWINVLKPTWSGVEYHIKPAPKPDIVFLRQLQLITDQDIVSWSISTPNLKLVFDGKTRELKSAEVIK